MDRPCFLVVDREFSGSISTRKLVIETAKFNVITAYSSPEAIHLLRRFPNVDGVVFDAHLPDMPCIELVAALRSIQPKAVFIAISSPRRAFCEGADHHLDSFEPAVLLDLLRRLEPNEAAAIDARNDQLKAEEC